MVAAARCAHTGENVLTESPTLKRQSSVGTCAGEANTTARRAGNLCRTQNRLGIISKRSICSASVGLARTPVHMIANAVLTYHRLPWSVRTSTPMVGLLLEWSIPNTLAARLPWSARNQRPCNVGGNWLGRQSVQAMMVSDDGLSGLRCARLAQCARITGQLPTASPRGQPTSSLRMHALDDLMLMWRRLKQADSLRPPCALRTRRTSQPR